MKIDLQEEPAVQDGICRRHQLRNNISPIDRTWVVYRTSVFSRDEIADIVDEVAALSYLLEDESSSSVAVKRRGFILPRSSDTVRIFGGGGDEGSSSSSLLEIVWQATGSRDYCLSLDIPVEVRVYGPGSSMAWHVDDVLYSPTPQVEVIWTLDNTSDSATLWKIGRNKSREDHSDTGENRVMRSVESDPNSVLLLRAGGAPHCVTTLKRGVRTVVKCAFVERGSEFRRDQYSRQFTTVASTTVRAGKKRKGRRKVEMAKRSRKR